MTSATDTPLLALLGKGALAGTAQGAAGDDRALEAAVEFAALLLDAGGLPAGKELPADPGNGLPGLIAEDAAADAEATIADAAQPGVLAPIVNEPVGDEIVAQIRNARAQPAVLQSGRKPPGPAREVPVPAARAAAPAQPPLPLDAVADATNTAVAAAARVDVTRSLPGSTRRGAEGLAARIEPLAGALGAVSRDGTATVSQATQAVPQLAGPDVMPGDGEWGRQFAERVGWVIQARVPQAQLTLNPEHLGPIEMAVEVEDAQARVQFAAAHATTREAIEQSLPRLRELLEQQGLELAQADVGGGDTAQSDGRAASDDLPADGGNIGLGRPAGADADGDETVAEDRGPLLRARGLVDTFV